MLHMFRPLPLGSCGPILDLYVEFRCLTSGRRLPAGHSILGCLAYYGLDGISVAEKKDMRELAMRGGPYTIDEKVALLDYCQTDVDALARLLHVMAPLIDTPRALYRGGYMGAVSRMERTGIPVDIETLAAVRENWGAIKGRLVAAVDEHYGVYEGLTFKRGQVRRLARPGGDRLAGARLGRAGPR
jgi:hypothetical protein